MKLNKFIKIKYALLVLLGFLLLSLSSKGGLLYLIRLNNSINELKTEIKKTEKQNQEYENKIQELYSNPKLFEIYARTKLGMVKKDEIIYELK